MLQVLLMVTYQSNYNGCSVHTRSDEDALDGLDCDDVRKIDQEFGDKMGQLEGAIVDKGDETFDEEDGWYGSYAEMQKFVKDKVTELFGEDQPFEFEIDSMSS